MAKFACTRARERSRRSPATSFRRHLTPPPRARAPHRRRSLARLPTLARALARSRSHARTHALANHNACTRARAPLACHVAPSSRDAPPYPRTRHRRSLARLLARPLSRAHARARTHGWVATCFIGLSMAVFFRRLSPSTCVFRLSSVVGALAIGMAA